MPEYGTGKKQYIDTVKHVKRVSDYKKHQEKYWRSENAELRKEDERQEKGAEAEKAEIGEGHRVEKSDSAT